MTELSRKNGKLLFVPVGFGHAFVTLEPNTEISYKVSDYYDPACDGGIRWNCPEIGIEWSMLASSVTISDKDKNLPLLEDFTSPFEYDGNPLELITVA